MSWLLPLTLGLRTVSLGIDTCYSVGWDSRGNYTEEGDSDAALVALQLIYPSVTYVRCRGTRMRFHLHGDNVHGAVHAAAQCLIPPTRGDDGYTERECAKSDYKPRLGETEQLFLGFAFGVIIVAVLICVFASGITIELSGAPPETEVVDLGRARRIFQVKPHHT